MSASRSSGLVSRLGKGLTGTTATTKHIEKPPEPDEDEVDDGGSAAEEIGKTFVYKSVLTPLEEAALDQSRRDKDDDDLEHFPLSVKQRNATYGDIQKPLRSCQLGPESEALCIAASSTGNMLAVGGRHGSIKLFHPGTLEPMDTIRVAELIPSTASTTTTTTATSSTTTTSSGAAAGGGGRASGGAAAASAAGTTGAGGLLRYAEREGVITSLCFRPDLSGSRMQNVLLAAQGDAVVHLHVGSHQALHTNREEGNRINTLAIRPDGAIFASAGSDCVVRAYDEATCALSRTLDHGDGLTTTGHTNHVFSLAWQPDDPQVLLSGGWDNRVLIWDLRVHRSVRALSGPHLCGDALDVQPGSGLVLTGSWRHRNPLQLWDPGSGRLLTNLPWWQPEQDACLLYAARFGGGSGGGAAGGGTVVAGGSGKQPMVRVYRLAARGNVELQFTVRLQRPVHALAVLPGGPAAADGSGPDRSMLAVCCDEEVHIVALGPRAAAPGP